MNAIARQPVASLADLRAAYDADRRAIDAQHPYLLGRVRLSTCRYCLARWYRWRGGQFDGHVRCVISREFRRDLVTFINASPQHTFALVGSALGVTPSVVTAWWRAEQKARRTR